MLAVNLENLLKFVQDRKYDAHIQEKTDQVVIELKIEDKTFPIFFRIFKESELLQMLLFFPTHIKEGSESDLARLLHVANKELDLPGFGMEEARKLFFYRQMIPIPGKELDETLLTKYLKAFETVLKTYGPVAVAVAVGQATFAEVIKKAKEKQGQNTKKDQ